MGAPDHVRLSGAGDGESRADSRREVKRPFLGRIG